MRSLTRRTMLGGATALPFITAAPAVAALGVDRAAWNAAIADYRAKYAAWVGAVDVEFAVESDTFEQRRAPGGDAAAEALHRAACEAREQASELREAAELRLIEAEAPDAAAWVERFGLFVADDYHHCNDAAAWNAAMLADLRRITRTEARNG